MVTRHVEAHKAFGVANACGRNSTDQKSKIGGSHRSLMAPAPIMAAPIVAGTDRRWAPIVAGTDCGFADTPFTPDVGIAKHGRLEVNRFRNAKYTSEAMIAGSNDLPGAMIAGSNDCREQ
jgi:hypothetical protein